MALPGSIWSAVIFGLFITTFGVLGCIKIIIYLILFILGCVCAIYLAIENDKSHPTKDVFLANPLQETRFPKYTPRVQSPSMDKNVFCDEKIDITGHKEVDSFFYEILDLVINDYVSSWYSIVTPDKDFLKAIKHLVCSFAVEISNRTKSVDWLLHITGKTVEDMVYHLRLFRGAGGNITSTTIRQPRRGSPAHSPARATPHHRRNKSDTDVASFSGSQKYSTVLKPHYNVMAPNSTLEMKFFEIELELEKKQFSRENICTDDNKKILLLQEISQIILFLAIKTDELRCHAICSVLRSIISSTLQSLLDYIVNPDTLNSLLLRMTCRDILSTESFLAVLRTSDNIEELKATLAIVQKEIHNLVSRDSGGECDIGVKQQLSSLQYLTRLLTTRTSLLAPTPPSMGSTVLMKDLPLGFLLDNQIALCYFLDFASSMSAHRYIFCHLSIEAWHAESLRNLAEMKKGNDNSKLTSEKCIRDSALTIHEQYFSKDSQDCLNIPVRLLESLYRKMNRPLDDDCLGWFVEINEWIHSKLQGVENAFRSSNQYTRLLDELGLEGTTMSEVSKVTDHRRTGSMGNTLICSKENFNSVSNESIDNLSEMEKQNISGSSKLLVENYRAVSPGPKTVQGNKVEANKPAIVTQELLCRLEVVIVETGLMQERGRAYGVYALEVKKWDTSSGKQHCWHVYRRYSDFHELYATIKEVYPELGKLEFPSKKTFHNTSPNVLQRRKVALSSWISTLASLGSPGGPPCYAPLHLYLLPFLNPCGPQDKQQSTGINSMLVQPLRQGMRTLRNVPEQLANTMGGLYRLINNNKNQSNSMSSSNQMFVFDYESNFENEELPLRFVLLLLDEVFELRCRNRWLRRQIAAVLRQILTTMFSDVLNRKIIDTISSVTSPSSVAYYLDSIKRAYFNDAKQLGNKKQTAPRDSSSQARARVAAKTVLLSCRQEELKHLIGSQTTQRGLITVFELFQNQILNTRLVFVLVEGLLKVLFQEKDISYSFRKILQNS